MAGIKSSMVVILMVIMVASLRFQPTAALTRHIVGDALGWTIPPGGAATYASWASKKAFTVGDTLYFNFTTGLHNVAEISQAAYDPCSATNTLSLNPTGPATLTLTRPGRHYYICTVVSHCQIGQKLTINVSPAATATSPESTSSPPFSVAVAPSSPTGSPIPPPSMSGSPSSAAVVHVTLVAVVLALVNI